MLSPRSGLFLLSLFSLHFSTFGFLPSSQQSVVGRRISSSSSTSLNVWWFGGSEQYEQQQDVDSCELVPVRIERTSPNSRRILGEIVAPSLTVDDLWSILTDYDRLTQHVPNLVESKMVARTSPGKPGDGEFTCKLYQKGAQKIVGFEFGASLTMTMREEILGANERRIQFRCVDSFFFQEFDGEWRVVEQTLADGSVESTLSYVVDVRPKGPVPVAALEWRIREDVPTNLRAVKRAAMERARRERSRMSSSIHQRSSLVGNLKASIMWERSETLAAYDQSNQ
jgi:Polyketide cyclase / dehydrase and lipid transport